MFTNSAVLEPTAQWADILSFALAAVSAIVAVIAWLVARKAKKRADDAVEQIAAALGRGFPESLAHASFQIRRADERSIVTRNVGGAPAIGVTLHSDEVDLERSAVRSKITFDLGIGEERVATFTTGAAAQLREISVTWREGQDDTIRSQAVVVERRA